MQTCKTVTGTSSGLRVVRGFCLVLLLLSLGGTVVDAAQRELTGTATGRIEYNDNVFLDENNQEEDFIATVTPTITGSFITERTQVRVAARLSWIKYQQLQELDDYDSRLNLTVVHSLDPRTQVETAASWRRDTRSDRDFVETGLVYDNVVRNIWDVSAALTRSHTERSSSRFGYAWQREDYPSERSDNVSLHSLDYSFFHSLSERLTLRTSLAYQRYHYATAKVENGSGTLGAQWQYDEKWDCSVDVGGRWTKTQREVVYYVYSPPYYYQFNETRESEDWGGVFKAGLTRRLASGSFSLKFSHDLSQVSGSADSTERTSFNLGYHHRFDRYWSWRLSTGYFINRTDDDSLTGSRRNEQSVSLSPSLRYEFNPNLALDLHYGFSIYDDDTSTGRARRNMVFLQLVWSDSLFNL